MQQRRLVARMRNGRIDHFTDTEYRTQGVFLTQFYRPLYRNSFPPFANSSVF
jgi:hypothetical protein